MKKKFMNRDKFIIALLIAICAVAAEAAVGDSGPQAANKTAPTYSAEGDAVVRHNGDRYNNRPLYFGAEPAFVLAGDRPLLRLIREPYVYGCFIAALVRDGQSKWLNECADVTMKYRPDHIEWVVKDGSLGETVVNLQAVPIVGAVGMAVRLQVQRARARDRLIWAYGSAKPEKGVLGAFEPSVWKPKIKMTFVPADCQGNRVRLEGAVFTVRPPVFENKPLTVAGRCSAVSRLVVADAGRWQSPLALSDSAAKDVPVVCGTTALETGQEIFWAVESIPHGRPAVTERLRDPAQAFATGLQRARVIGRQVVVETPDSRFNIGVAVSCAAVDALWSPPMFHHGVMAWRYPYIGWRTMFGATAYGWHDRVQTQVKFLAESQIKESTNVTHKPDPKTGLSMQANDSCYYQGRGKLRSRNEGYQSCYNMQTQFFDQAIQDWRYTADAAMETILRPALELHLEWIKNCFDPDDDGVYESYLNTWPTDNQWYNGGGTAEETSYAYRGHKAALDMARRAGDEKAVRVHQRQLEKIRTGFFQSLWIARKGHSGAYREQSGYKRLHEDCWLYSIFLPIDAELLSAEQATSSLHFTEYGLERFTMRHGGQRVITSNWIPDIRTVRRMHCGDNYHLALAYFQTGLADDGWNVLRGTYLDTMYDTAAPGEVAGGWGVDFGDSAHMFCRAVVEGVFGYTPDYPNGIVKLAPQFPPEWDRASIRTPDMSSKFERKGEAITYDVDLTRPAALDIRLTVRARSMSAVTVNGQPASWELLPGFGNSVLRILVSPCRKAHIEATCADSLPQFPAVLIEATVGQKLVLQPEGANVIEFKDSQGTLSQAAIHDDKIVGRVSDNTGDHLVLALVEVGQARQWRAFKLHITDPPAEARRRAKQVDKAPAGATWECMVLDAIVNGDIRTIYRQQYLSPRPQTCSLRLALDGYRTWMMRPPQGSPPEIDLTRVPALLQGPNRLVTPQGVPFRWIGENRNVAFTSQWDNWPSTTTMPVKRKAEAIWFLICGSTNPMQTQIANAELRMKYTNGVVEKLELVPPLNYWNLCPIDGQDYDYNRLGFCLPKIRPQTIQLGANCRAMVLNWRLLDGVELESVTLETLSQEVVVGLMGVSLMNPRR